MRRQAGEDAMQFGPLAQSSILVVCDKPDEAELLTQILERERFAVLRSGLDFGRLTLQDEQVDVVVIDMTSHAKKGLCVASRFRAHSSVGIIIVHHPEDRLDPVDGFDVGADDVIGRPFRSDELVARVKSVARRVRLRSETRQLPGETSHIRFGGWTLQLETRTLESPSGQHVALTGAEYDLLLVFLRNPARVLSRDQILMMTKGRSWQPNDRSLDILVVRLRRKLGGNGHDALIKPVRHIGYIFCLRSSEIFVEALAQSRV